MTCIISEFRGQFLSYYKTISEIHPQGKGRVKEINYLYLFPDAYSGSKCSKSEGLTHPAGRSSPFI